jgi:ssRNA-specific RNase YbeY (16S rRNA maturation enzyme)
VRDEAEQKGASAARSFGARRCRGAVGAIQVEVENRSEVEVEVDAAVALARRLLEEEGIDEAELGIAFVGPNESRALKREYLGIDEATDVVLCPAVVGEQWRRPLAHGLLHLLGYEHGAEMERREESYAA